MQICLPCVFLVSYWKLKASESKCLLEMPFFWWHHNNRGRPTTTHLTLWGVANSDRIPPTGQPCINNDLVGVATWKRNFSHFSTLFWEISFSSYNHNTWSSFSRQKKNHGTASLMKGHLVFSMQNPIGLRRWKLYFNNKNILVKVTSLMKKKCSHEEIKHLI